MQTVSDLSQIYQCMLKNISIQCLTTELKYFNFMVKFLNHCEEKKYFTKTKNEISIIKTRIQNFLLKSWNESKDRGEEKIENLKVIMKRILKGKPGKKRKSSGKDISLSGRHLTKKRSNISITRKSPRERTIDKNLVNTLKEVEDEFGIEKDGISNFHDINNFLKILFDKKNNNEADQQRMKYEISPLHSELNSRIESYQSQPVYTLENKQKEKKLLDNRSLLQAHLEHSPLLGNLTPVERISMGEGSFGRSSFAERNSPEGHNSFQNGKKNLNSIDTIEVHHYNDLKNKMIKVKSKDKIAKRFKKPPSLVKSFGTKKNKKLFGHKQSIISSHRQKMNSTLKKKPRNSHSYKNLIFATAQSDKKGIQEPSKAKRGFSITNFNKDFVEEGIVNRVLRINKTRFLLNIETGKLVVYDLENCNRVLEPSTISEKNIIGLIIGISGKIWVSTFKGLFIFDVNLKFIMEVEKTNHKDDLLFDRPETLEMSKSSYYIYHLQSPSQLSKINPETCNVVQKFDRNTIGQDNFKFRIISKRYMVNLNSARNYFKLCNLCSKKKEGGIKLRDHQDNSVLICISFDVTKKGNRLFVAASNQNKYRHYLAIYKITQSGFIFKRKIQNFFENGIAVVRLVEGLYEKDEDDDGFLVVAGLKDISLYSFSGYTLKQKCFEEESGKRKNISLCFDRGVAVVSSDNQSIEFYKINQDLKDENKRCQTRQNSESKMKNFFSHPSQHF